MLRAVGFEEEDFARPQVGIASTWSMITPCNMHINDLAQLAAKGADDAELLEVEQTAIPGPGARGGMYTANTMASAIEALGMGLANRYTGACASQ